MWTRENRGLYERKGLRYPSDLRDEEWALIEPLIPPAKRGGRKRSVGGREVRCARGDERGFLCSGDRLPVACVAQGSAAEVHGARLSHAVGLGRHAGAHPSRALPHGPGSGGPRGLAECRGDRQPEREKRGKRGARIDPSGYDAGKKVTGKKRHLLVDTLGLILAVAVHPASLQDRDGALLVLDRHTRRLFPFLETIFADGAYGGQKLRRAMADAAWRIESVKRSAQAKGFEPGQGLRGHPQALGRRAHHRLDQPLPAPRQGLRKPQPNRHRLHPPRQHQAHAQKTHPLLLSLMNFPDRL